MPLDHEHTLYYSKHKKERRTIRNTEGKERKIKSGSNGYGKAMQT
jgi:hypothetical protein